MSCYEHTSVHHIGTTGNVSALIRSPSSHTATLSLKLFMIFIHGFYKADFKIIVLGFNSDKI